MTAVAKKTLTLVDTGGGSKPPGGGSPSSESWQSLLTTNRDGRYDGSLHNVMLILENDARVSGMFWLNEAKNRVMLHRDPPWSGGTRDEFIDADSCEMAAWLQHPSHYGMSVGDDQVLKAVTTVARRHRRHPLKEYLNSLTWDGVPRVERLIVDMLGTEDRLYNRQVSLCFMVSAAARVLWFDPQKPNIGAKVDFMVVLEDKQGRKKTTFFETLFGANWFVETMESPQHNDFYQILQGCWGVEIAEMHSFGKAEVGRIKGALSRRMDRYRAPYERQPRDWRRENVFVGTTNDVTGYLRDSSGGRRFLPVRLDSSGQADIAKVAEIRDQLWAEAVHLFRDGFEYWVLPADAEEEQEQRFVEDSWEGRISRWLRGTVLAKGPNESPPYPSRYAYGVDPVQWVTTDELLTFAIGLDAGKHGRSEQMRISEIMGQRLEWIQARQAWADTGTDRERRWFRDQDVLGAAKCAAKGQPNVKPSASAGKDDDCPF